VCDLINPVVNPIPVLYSRRIRVTIALHLNKRLVLETYQVLFPPHPHPTAYQFGAQKNSKKCVDSEGPLEEFSNKRKRRTRHLTRSCSLKFPLFEVSVAIGAALTPEELRAAYVTSDESCPLNIRQPENVTESKHSLKTVRPIAI
jgi:hypothetical protein